MAEPIKWRSKLILVKAEPLNAYGVDAAPTGAVNAMLLTNVQFQPMEGQEVSRNLELPYMGAQESLPVGLYCVLTGDFELVGSGAAGTAPAWSPLIRSCGVAEVITPGETVEYTPITEDHESVTAYFQIGVNRYVMLGARSTAQFSINAMGIPVCRITMTGLFTIPSVQARPTVNLTAWQKPQVASKATTPVFTIDAMPLTGRDFQLTLGCEVQPRMLFNQERVLIVDRAETISLTVEAVPLTTYNPITAAGSPTVEAPRVPIEVEHGTIVGRKVRIEAQSCVQQRFAGSQENQKIEEWPLTFMPLQVGGNDQWKITVS
ncbi:hypothetical protein OVY48_09875 [Sphingobium sp. SA2]|uniref:hypothetical protein n=1 Tax=Sphingobium sp. SA2 TaxID=1524832 RepID=UPI0028C1FBA5|nr:hypothetical protein [Sphingobium sp. SA2]MDT7533731.1 hypothetical protein [Sphingobium sp. SA2]